MAYPPDTSVQNNHPQLFEFNRSRKGLRVKQSSAECWFIGDFERELLHGITWYCRDTPGFEQVRTRFENTILYRISR